MEEVSECTRSSSSYSKMGVPPFHFTTTDKKAFTFSWLISQVSFLLYTAAAATVPRRTSAATMWCATVAATAAAAVSTAGAGTALKRLQHRRRITPATAATTGRDKNLTTMPIRKLCALPHRQVHLWQKHATRRPLFSNGEPIFIETLGVYCLNMYK